MIRQFSSKLYLQGAFCILAVLSGSGYAANSLPLNAPFPDTVFLRHSCGNLPNCADNMPEMLNWIWGVRQPSAGSPLLLDIGTGDFYNFNCGFISTYPGIGNLTVRGSGRENTRINNSLSLPGGAGGSAIGNDGAAILVKDCENMAFQDFTTTNADSGVRWFGGGNATWTNVRIHGDRMGFWDTSTGSSLPAAVHYWFGSKVDVENTVNPLGSQSAAFFVYGGEHWFYGGEVTLIAHSTGSQVAAIYLTTSTNPGSIRLFGSLVRAIAADNATLSDTLYGVTLAADNVFHMHGGQIAVDASKAASPDVSVWGLKGGFYGNAHTPGTAYSITAKGSGTAIRARGKGVSDAFLWPSGPTPPAILGSRGKDLFVETDCDDVTGNCDGGGDGTHLMITNSKRCGVQTPWFDTFTKQCRK